jgi:hypothetical protein
MHAMKHKHAAQNEENRRNTTWTFSNWFERWAQVLLDECILPNQK